MFVNNKTHYLSNALFVAAGVHVASNMIMSFIRWLIREQVSADPYITNSYVLAGQIAVSAVQVILITLVFFGAMDKLKKAMSLIEESDRLQMGILQQEALGSKVPALMGDSISKLLELWAFILVGVRMVYDISSIVYRKFVMDLMSLGSTDETANEVFVAIYNNTHGFKYVGLLIAILLGSMMTGIFLNDRMLKIITMIILAFFVLSFVLLGMQTLTLAGYRVGIVWTSVIFHLIETVGILGLGFYVRKRYIGL